MHPNSIVALQLKKCDVHIPTNSLLDVEMLIKMLETCRTVELGNDEGVAEGHEQAGQEKHHNVHLEIVKMGLIYCELIQFDII